MPSQEPIYNSMRPVASWHGALPTPTSSSTEGQGSLARVLDNTSGAMRECHAILDKIESAIAGTGDEPAKPGGAAGIFQGSLELLNETHRLRVRLEGILTVLAA